MIRMEVSMAAIMRSTVLVLLPVSACIFLTAGCWNSTELNDLAIVTGAGIDLTEDEQIELSVKIYLTSPSGSEQIGDGLGESSGGGSGSGTSIVRSVTGVNMADASSKLQKLLSRKVFWGQTEVLLFGARMAQAGLDVPMDFLMRHTASRERASMFVCDGTAKEVLLLEPQVERSVAEILRSMAEMQTGLNITMRELALMMAGKSRAAVLPLVVIQSREDHQEAYPIIRGTAVVKNGRMIGKMDEDATLGIMWLRNEIKNATVTVSPDGMQGYVSFLLTENRTRLIPNIENGRWSITVRIKSRDDIVENTTELDLSKPDHIGKVEAELEKVVENRVQLALHQAQKEMKADIFQFADAFYRKYPKIWQANKDRWEEIYPHVDVKLEISIHAARPGLIGKNTFKREQR